MKLVGMFDSPYVRRVAISMRVLGFPFEHLNWSIGRDQARVAELNPLGQVPILVLDDGEAIVDSATILDHLDQRAGERALVPRSGESRRQVLHVATLATGVADKARLQATERLFRPAALRHPPYQDRLRTQMLAGCGALERLCAARGDAEWLFGDAISQADISVLCALTYATEAAGLTLESGSALGTRHARLAALPVARDIYMPFDAPVVE